MIAWLLLHHCFLAAYSAQIEHTEANIPSKPHHALHQALSHDYPIYHFINTILDSIDRELSNFHLADEHLSNMICNLNPNPVDDAVTPNRHVEDPIKQLFTSLSDKINSEIHSLEITDLLLTNAIANLELVYVNGVDANAIFEEPPHAPTPQHHAQTTNLPSRLGPSTHPTAHKHSPSTPSLPLSLQGEINAGTPRDSP